MILAILSLVAFGQDIRVDDLGSLRAALAQSRPGTRILVGPHEFSGGLFVTNVHGIKESPVILAAADPQHPPTFKGAIQFEAVSYLEVRDLSILGVSGNAIGIDDNGVRDKPAHHITLKGLRIIDAPGGGTNGIKMAGVDDFHIDSCTVDRWGGCAIDLVGCHRGLIENCKFTNGQGLGVQAKGASLDVTVRRCSFKDYGGRGINIGGSTGIPYFRPPLEAFPSGLRYEAKNIVVEGCTFQGGGAPVAFVGCDTSVFRFNTIDRPQQWAMRILQETSTPDFLPSRNGRFEDNLVVFQSAHWFEGGVNIGPGTAPNTFRFARNWWFCEDNPSRSQPTLPSTEYGSNSGKDPILDHQSLKLSSDSPAKFVGAQAFIK
jgi:hypothetical protein